MTEGSKLEIALEAIIHRMPEAMTGDKVIQGLYVGLDQCPKLDLEDATNFKVYLKET